MSSLPIPASVPGLHQKHDGPGPLDDRMVVARRVRQFRRWRGLSVLQLAARGHVSKSTLYLIERGARMPTKRTVLKLSQVLQVDPGALFRPDGRCRNQRFLVAPPARERVDVAAK